MKRFLLIGLLSSSLLAGWFDQKPIQFNPSPSVIENSGAAAESPSRSFGEIRRQRNFDNQLRQRESYMEQK